MLLPNGDVVDEIVLDTKNLTSVAAPIKSALEFLGADIKLKILNPKLMVAGMNFSINLNAAAFTPGSGVCSLPGSPCTNLVFNVSNVNLGKEILAWLRTNNNNYKNGEPYRGFKTMEHCDWQIACLVCLPQVLFHLI